LGLTPGPDAYDPRSNIDAGTKYLKSQLDFYADQGDMQVPYALAAYNWGGANVNAAIRGEKQIPAETANYIKAVTKQWQAMARRSQ
jgi:soluble lytic murein transglycosylase-like protein